MTDIKSLIKQDIDNILWMYHERFPHVPLERFEMVVKEILGEAFARDLTGKSDDDLKNIASELNDKLSLKLAKETA